MRDLPGIGSLPIDDTDPSGATIYRTPSGAPWQPGLPLAQPVDPTTGASTMPIAADPSLYAPGTAGAIANARYGGPDSTPDDPQHMHGYRTPAQIGFVPGQYPPPESVVTDPQRMHGYRTPVPDPRYPQPPSAAGTDTGVPQLPAVTSATAADAQGQPRPTADAPVEKVTARDPTGRNNPGNIRPSGSSDGFESYPTMDAGIQAIRGNLLSYQDQHGLNTVRGIITRWAPPNENPTEQLIANAAHRTGFGPDQPIDLHDPDTMKKMTDAIIVQEQGSGSSGPPSTDITAGMTPEGRARFAAVNEEYNTIKRALDGILKKMNETDPSDPEMRALLRQHREYSQQLEQAYLDRAFHAPQRTQRDIMGQFGSLAMLAGVLGGFGARVPAIASLNAAGAAMEAMNANDDRAYRDQMKVWEFQTTALHNAISMEHDQIKDILDDKKTSLAEKHQALEEAFRVLGLEKGLAELRIGNYESISQDQERKIKMALDIEELKKRQMENASIQAWGGALGKDTEENRLVQAELMRRAKELNPQASDDQVLQDAQRLAHDPIEYPAAVQRAHADVRPKDPPNWEWTDAETGTRKSGAARIGAGGGLEDIDGNKINAVPGSERRLSVSAPEQLAPYSGPDTWSGMPRKPPPGIDPGIWSMALDYAQSGRPPAALGRASPQQRAQFWQAYPVAQQALGIDPITEADHWIDYAAKREARVSIERAFGGGMLGRNLISLNTVADHISLFRQYAEALRNHDAIRVNQLQNRLATEAGSAEVINYALAARITGDEVVRLLTTSGGTITDREDIATRLAAYSSPEQFEGAANTLTNFVRSRYAPLRQQYARGDPERERVFDETMVTPEARTLFQAPPLPPIRQGGGAAGATTPSTPAPSGAPDWARGGQAGVKYDNQGNAIYWDGKMWAHPDHSPVQPAQ